MHGREVLEDVVTDECVSGSLRNLLDKVDWGAHHRDRFGRAAIGSR